MKNWALTPAFEQWKRPHQRQNDNESRRKSETKDVPKTNWSSSSREEWSMMIKQKIENMPLGLAIRSYWSPWQSWFQEWESEARGFQSQWEKGSTDGT